MDLNWHPFSGIGTRTKLQNFYSFLELKPKSKLWEKKNLNTSLISLGKEAKTWVKIYKYIELHK